MLKQFYKTFVVALISGSLLSLQMDVAFAQSSSRGVTTTDSNGVITNTKNYKFEKISDTDMLASITMLASGFITGRMLVSYNPVTMDVMIAGAGGAAFVAGEVLSNMKFKDTMDGMTAEVTKKSDGTINEEQIQRLIDLKKSYSEAKNTTKTKKMLQLASAAAFGAAAITSTYMALTEEAHITKCRATIQAMKTSLASCVATGTAAAATGYAAEEGAACGLCQPILQQYEFLFNKYNVGRKAPGISFVRDNIANVDEKLLMNPMGYCSTVSGVAVKAVTASMGASCKSSVLMSIKNETSAIKPVVVTQNMLKKLLKLPATALMTPINHTSEGFFENSLNFLFPKAEASWLPLLGLGASTAAAFTLITGTTATQLDTLMFVPSNRAIAFGLLSGLAYMASQSSENVIGKLDGNIKQIDVVLADLAKLAKGVKAQNLIQQAISIQTVNPASIAITAANSTSSSTTSCMTSNNSTNCPSLENQLRSMPGFGNLPESFQNIASQSVKVADGLSGTSTISGATLSAADSLGSSQAAIAKMLKNREDALEKLSGGKIDIQQTKEKLLNSLNEKVKKDLQQKGMTATGMMASIGGTPIETSSGKAVKEKMVKSSISSSRTTTDISSGGGADKEAATLKLDFKEQKGDENYAANDSGLPAKAPVYDIKENEISKESGPTLFEVISSRYIKSGYPKLLEEEQSKN